MSATLVGAVRSWACGVVPGGAEIVVVRCSTRLGSAPATASTATTAPTPRAPRSMKKRFEERLMTVMVVADRQRRLRAACATAKTAPLRRGGRSGGLADAREAGAHPLPPARPRGGRAEAGGGRDRRTDLRDPVLERQLARDQAVQRVGHGRLDLRARERVREQRHEVERLDGLADAAGDLARRQAAREQLTGLPVAALGREGGAHEVARAGEPDHRLGARALLLGVPPDLEEDMARRGARGVEALRLGGAGREGGGVLGGA